MSILDEWHEENVERIIRVLKKHEDDSINECEFCGRDEALRKFAEDIIDVLPLEVY